jgi:hypothetical protein
VTEFFSIADLGRLREQRSLVLEGLSTIRSSKNELKQLRDLKFRIDGFNASDRPWRHGYRLARELRGRLDAEHVQIDSFKALAQALRLDLAELDSAVMPVLARVGGLDAIVDVNSAASPAFAVVPRNEPSKLFAVCRAIFEYLIAPDARPQIVTRSHSDRQKRNRAFAAEFLVPAEQLKGLLPDGVITSDVVDDLADRLGASSAVVRHQIENHRLATVADWE